MDNKRLPLFEQALAEATTGDIIKVKYFGAWADVKVLNGTNVMAVGMGSLNGREVFTTLGLGEVLSSCDMAIEDIICKSRTCENLKQYINELQS